MSLAQSNSQQWQGLIHAYLSMQKSSFKVQADALYGGCPRPAATDGS